jgi:hypothetical protein
MLIVCESCIGAVWGAPDPSAVPAGFAWAEAEASRESDMTVAVSSFIVWIPLATPIVEIDHAIACSINRDEFFKKQGSP